MRLGLLLCRAGGKTVSLNSRIETIVSSDSFVLVAIGKQALYTSLRYKRELNRLRFDIKNPSFS